MDDHRPSPIPSLQDRLVEFLSAHPKELVSLLSRYVSQGKGILQPHQLLAEFEAVISKGDEQNIKGSAFGDVLRATQEAIVSPPWVALAVRPRPGIWEYICVNVKELAVEELSVSEYLKFKEDLSDESFNNNFVLKPDFDPSTDSFPRPTLSKSIGNGVEFLNRHLSSKLFHDRDSLHPLFDFLQAHKYKGKTMMLNGKIQSLNALQSVMKNAEEYLSRLPPETPYSEFDDEFQEMGIEKGWGDTAGHVLEMVHLLLELLETPQPCTLEKFLGRIPMVFNVVILSPHGSFSQSNVLGLPNTGGQVVYILDQVRALEHEMLLRIKQQGLDIMPRILIVTGLLPDAVGTTCSQRLEKVLGTDHASILRVPCRMEKGILRERISRFDVQPYLETYMEDVALEIGGELNATPDLIIGNYIDGNRVASLLARKLGVTQCTTAHALEETKYLDSDIYWKKLDEKYHFSCQFPADLIAMNHMDSSITSTFQEIAGRYTWKTYSERLMTLAGVYGFWKYVSKLESYLDLSSHHGSYQTSSDKTMAEIAMGHHIINVQEDHMDMLVAAVPTLVGETLVWKDVLMVVVPSITVSAIGLVDLSDGVYVDPSHEILSKAYAFAVFTAFTLAMGLLLLSATLPRVPVSVAMVKKLMWVAVALVYIALALKAALLILS